MKKLILIITFTVLSSCNYAYGQTVSPTPDRNAPVTTTQGFISDATKAFELVSAQRDALDKALAQISASDVTKAALKEQIQALNDLITIKDRKAALYEDMAKVYDRIIAIQRDMIDRLTAQLNKPKSAWQKVLAVLTRMGDIALGIAVGRVL